VFLDAVACTLAAFHPHVKQTLIRRGALMPTVQMILRRCSKKVGSDADYLTGRAHPTAFVGADVDVGKMVQMAHDVRLDELPPLSRVRVVYEDEAVPGRDYFDSTREQLFDTPFAIARIVRSTKFERRMIVSAELSEDFNGRPLSFHWAVLRGDADRIRILPLVDDKSKAEIVIPYHRRRPVDGNPTLQSSRVDIGVFVHNGKYYSPPAFVTFCSLDNERRVYNAQQQIDSVQYSEGSQRGIYADPMIAPRKNWLDRYQYDDQQRLLGWTRLKDGQLQSFTADGALVIERDALGRPLRARQVKYTIRRRPDQVPYVVSEPTDKILRYEYDSPTDRLGRSVPIDAGS
jgi:hypothetical protein